MKIFILNQDNNLNYKIPDNKKLLMMDFYLITYLNSMYDEKHILDVNEKVKFSLKEAENSILIYLKSHFLDIVHFAISAEFRHLFDRSKKRKIKNKKDIISFLKKYNLLFVSKYKEQRVNKDSLLEHPDSNNQEYLIAYDTVKSLNISRFDFVNIAKFCFENFKWDKDYGGMEWAKICDGWFKLNNAKSKSDITTAIDYIYHLQHNSGSIFTKLDSYKVDYSFMWIEDSLNFKSDLKSLWSLYEKISPSLKRISAFIIKKITNESYDEYKNSELEKEFKNISRNGTLISSENEDLISKILDSGKFPESLVTGIFNYINYRGRPPSFAKQWISNQIETGNYHPYIENKLLESIYNNIDGYYLSYFFKFIRNLFDSGEHREAFINFIANSIENISGSFPKFAAFFMSEKMKENNLPKEIENALINFSFKSGFLPYYANKWFLNKVKSYEFRSLIEDKAKEYFSNPFEHLLGYDSSFQDGEEKNIL